MTHTQVSVILVSNGDNPFLRNVREQRSTPTARMGPHMNLDGSAILRAVLMYVKVFVVYLIVDVIYLVLPPVASYNQNVIEAVQGGPVEVRLVPALAVYVVGAAGLTWIIAHAKDGWQVPSAAFMGFCTYGIYDLTNYATFLRYPFEMVVRDMLWGTAAFGISTFVYTRFLSCWPSTAPPQSSGQQQQQLDEGAPADQIKLY